MKSNITKKFKTTKSAKSGFTIVEISIAIAFIGMLLIAISIITTNVLSIYRKGSTLKAVNSVGRSLVDNFTSAINSAPSIDTTSLCSGLTKNATALENCRLDSAYGYIFHANYAPTIDTDGDGVDDSGGEQYNGVFCTGNYSYIWNTFYGKEAKKVLKLKYRSEDGATHQIPAEDADENEVLRLVRVKDSTYRVCSSVMTTDYTLSDGFDSSINSTIIIDISDLANSTEYIPLPNPIPEPETGMLTEFDTDLMLYELTVFPISQDAVTLRTFMVGSFILATLRGDVDVTRSGDYCQASVIEVGEDGDSSTMFDLGTEFNYCGINKFSFAARTAGV